MMRGLPALALCVLAALAATPSPAGAVVQQKKAIWGPVNEFPTYNELGVGIYQYGLGWDAVAPTRPADPTNPADPAYKWPADLDFALSEAQKYGIRVSIQVLRSPPWANGGHGPGYAPRSASDYAAFVTAAARRYPAANIWQIWGEPVIGSRFKPLKKKRSPRLYAQMLDQSYEALKAINPANLVVGGMTITEGQIKPLAWMRLLRLPNGKPPRMDMWGHNPYSPRKPKLKRRPVKPGVFDMSDLDTMIKELDRNLRKGKRNKKLKIFISEWSIPTDHRASIFGFWGDRKTVANYTTKALKIAKRLKRVYTFGWFYLYDEAPNQKGDEVNWGLLTWDGQRKPAFFAFRDG
jgi:hypothetical protein